MFTVVILSEGAQQIFEGARMYFEPFEQSGQLYFCEWNQAPSACSPSEILPGLREAIRGKGEWRAVVVESAPEIVTSSQRTAQTNPFDYLDNVSEDETGRSRLLLNLENSKHPLVRVSHALLGYPAMGAKGFERVLRYTVGDTLTGREREVVNAESELVANGTTLQSALTAARKDDTKFNAQVQFQDVAYSHAEVAAHEGLIERYRMRDVRPTEVMFVATRLPVETDPKVELVGAWRTEGAGDRDASRFVERNDYPPSSRFAVYDLPSFEHSGYEQHVLRFWLSVLSLAVNQLPPSAFQADRVYSLGIELSESALAEVLNGHMSRLNAIREHVTQLIRQPARQPDSTVEDKVKPQRVHVEFDRLDGSELTVDTSGYGLAGDLPRPAGPRWQYEVAQLRIAADAFIRRPRRVLQASVWNARASARSYLSRDIELNEIEREEVEEELQKRMARLAQPATADVLDPAQLRRLISDHDERIAAQLRQQLRLKPILLALAVVLAVWALGLTPYLMQAATKPAPALGDSLLVAISVLVVMMLIVLGTLIVMRLRIIRMLRAFNLALRGFSTRVTSGAGLFADYLSDFATYRHASALLIGASRRHDRNSGRLRRLSALRARVSALIENEKGIVVSIGEPLAIQRMRVGVADFDPDDEAGVRALFRLPVGEGRAAFNQSGEKVDAPYDFITSLTVERIRLFEADAHSAAAISAEDFASAAADSATASASAHTLRSGGRG